MDHGEGKVAPPVGCQSPLDVLIRPSSIGFEGYDPGDRIGKGEILGCRLGCRYTVHSVEGRDLSIPSLPS